MCGALSCHDFTNWVGEAIHLREGFYFRHDSLLNPNSKQFAEDKMKLENISIEEQECLIS